MNTIKILLIGALASVLVLGFMLLPSAPIEPPAPPDLASFFKWRYSPPEPKEKRPWLNPARAALAI